MKHYTLSEKSIFMKWNPHKFPALFYFIFGKKRGKWGVNDFSQLITLTLFENTFQLMNHNAKVTCWEDFRSLARPADSDKLKWANDSRRERPKVVFSSSCADIFLLLIDFIYSNIFIVCTYTHAREIFFKRFLCLSMWCRFFVDDN